MAYSVYGDVQSEFKNIDFNTTSSVLATEVTEFIAQSDAYINSRIGLKYVVPITGATSLAIIKRLSIWLTAGRIKEILKVKLSGTDVGSQQIREGDLAKMARDEIDMIVSGLLLLSDAILASSADGVRSFAVDDDQDFTFDKSSQQW